MTSRPSIDSPASAGVIVRATQSLQDPGHQRFGSYWRTHLFRDHSCSRLIQGGACTQGLLLHRYLMNHSVSEARPAGENYL